MTVGLSGADDDDDSDDTDEVARAKDVEFELLATRLLVFIWKGVVGPREEVGCEVDCDICLVS